VPGSDAASGCIDCAAGKYVPVPGSDAASGCIDCAAGKYGSASGSDTASACIDCAAGKYTAAAGRSECADCPPGGFQTTAGQSVCTCPVELAAVGAATDGQGGFTELYGAMAVATFEAGGSTYAIVASYWDDGIQLVDVSDPSSPVAVGAATDGQGGFTELDGANAVATFEAGGSTYAIVASYDDHGIQLASLSSC